MSEHCDGCFDSRCLMSTAVGTVPTYCISKQILDARSKNLANIYYNYLQNFPILSVVFRGETHSTRNTPRGCTELLMVPTRNHLLFWGHCVVECKFQ